MLSVHLTSPVSTESVRILVLGYVAQMPTVELGITYQSVFAIEGSMEIHFHNATELQVSIYD